MTKTPEEQEAIEQAFRDYYAKADPFLTGSAAARMDFLAGASYAAPRWVYFEDQKPEDGRMVLAWTPSRGVIMECFVWGVMKDGVFEYAQKDPEDLEDKFLAWFPLPAPPKL